MYAHHWFSYVCACVAQKSFTCRRVSCRHSSRLSEKTAHVNSNFATFQNSIITKIRYHDFRVQNNNRTPCRMYEEDDWSNSARVIKVEVDINIKEKWSVVSVNIHDNIMIMSCQKLGCYYWTVSLQSHNNFMKCGMVH